MFSETPALRDSFYTTVIDLRLFQQAQTDAPTMSLADRFESESVVIISDGNACANQMGEDLLCSLGTGTGTKTIVEPNVIITTRASTNQLRGNKVFPYHQCRRRVIHAPVLRRLPLAPQRGPTASWNLGKRRRRSNREPDRGAKMLPPPRILISRACGTLDGSS